MYNVNIEYMEDCTNIGSMMQRNVMCVFDGDDSVTAPRENVSIKHMDAQKYHAWNSPYEAKPYIVDFKC